MLLLLACLMPECDVVTTCLFSCMAMDEIGMERTACKRSPTAVAWWTCHLVRPSTFGKDWHNKLVMVWRV